MRFMNNVNKGTTTAIKIAKDEKTKYKSKYSQINIIIEAATWEEEQGDATVI